MKDLITHAVFQKEETVDWEAVLKQYIAFPSSIDEEEYEKYYELAHSWSTCACGQLPHIIKRIDGEPEDSELRNWGSAFTTAFQERDFPLALQYVKRLKIKAPAVVAEQQFRAEFAVLMLEEELAEVKEEQKKAQAKLTEAKKTLKAY